MDSLHQLELIILLLAVVLALTTVANRVLIPYPIVLVIGGLVLGVLPGLPTIALNPDLVFVVFLPPILWSAAYFTSLRDFRDNLRPISLLAVGLVLATTAAVALVAHRFLGFGWAEAIALGAIVSPPDAVSATAIAKRLSIPRRIVTILEGESLVNDATALVLSRAAVAAVVSGSFALGETVVQFVYAVVVGVAIGLLVGWLTLLALRAIGDSFTEIAVTLLAPYVAWIAGESFHASAVLSCVAGGLYLRRHFSRVVAPVTRIQGRAVWELIVFLLNGVIFILIGLQLGALQAAIPPNQVGALLVGGVLISLTAILVRVGWVPTSAVISRCLSPALRARDPLPRWRHLFLIGWTGMRGIVTLAGAMALPMSTHTGEPFPHREEIILLSFAVIFATLVLQGLTLAPLIRILGVSGGSEGEREEMQAREHAAKAALNRLDELRAEEWPNPQHLEQLHAHYDQRQRRFTPEVEVDPDCKQETREVLLRLREEVLAAERLALIRLRDEGVVSDEVLHRLEHELDVEALRLGLGERRLQYES